MIPTRNQIGLYMAESYRCFYYCTSKLERFFATQLTYFIFLLEVLYKIFLSGVFAFQNRKRKAATGGS
jgi:hypothetical protein